MGNRCRSFSFKPILDRANYRVAAVFTRGQFSGFAGNAECGIYINSVDLFVEKANSCRLSNCKPKVTRVQYRTAVPLYQKHD